MRILLSLTLLLFVAASANAESRVTLTEKEHAIDVKIDGKPFATYQTNPNQPKPYFSPVLTPGGKGMTRPIFDENGNEHKEHKHHRGIWVAIDEVNKNKHWAETQKIKHVKSKIVTASGNPAKLRVINHWLNDDGTTSVIEKTTIRIYANRLFVYDITFQAPKNKPVLFEDTKEGLFGYRMAHSMRESEGGHVVNADGKQGTKECWGQRSAWVDYYGDVEGETVGVTLMDSPKNFMPSRYHVRNYGLFSVSPFGEKAYTRGEQDASHYELDAGKSFTLTYGLYIHTGDTKAGKVAEAYEQFVKAGEKKK